MTMYILVNTRSGNYFKREQMNGVCVDVTVKEEARQFDDYKSAVSKAMFLSEKDIYKVIELENN